MKNLKYELLIDGKKEVAYVDPNNQEKFLEKHSNSFPVEVLNIEDIEQDLKLEKTSGLGKLQGTNQSQITPITTPKIDTDFKLEDTSSEYVSSLPSTGSNIPFGEPQFDPNFSYDTDGNMEYPDDDDEIEITEEEEEEEDLTRLSSIKDDKFQELLSQYFPDMDPNNITFGTFYDHKGKYLQAWETGLSRREKKKVGYKGFDPFGQNELDVGTKGGILIIQGKSRIQWEKEGKLQDYENLRYLLRITQQSIPSKDIGPSGEWTGIYADYEDPETKEKELTLEEGEVGWKEMLKEREKTEQVLVTGIDDDTLIEVKLEEKTQKGNIYNYIAHDQHKDNELLEDFYEVLLDPDNETGVKWFGKKRIEIDELSKAFWDTKGGKSLLADIEKKTNRKFGKEWKKLQKTIQLSPEYATYKENLIEEFLVEFPNSACYNKKGIRIHDADCAEPEQVDAFNQKLNMPIFEGEIFEKYDNGISESVIAFQHELQMTDKRYLSYQNKNINPIIAEIAKNNIQSFASTWALKSDFFDGSDDRDLGVFEARLAKWGFFKPETNAQNRAEMLQRFWGIIKNESYADLDDVSLAEAEKEYYAHFFNKLEIDRGVWSEGKKSHFYLKIVASDIGRWTKGMWAFDKNYKKVNTIALSNEAWVGGINGPRTTIPAIGNFHWVSNSRGTGGTWTLWSEVNNNPNYTKANFGGGKTFKLTYGWKKNTELVKIYDRLIDQMIDGKFFTKEQIESLEKGNKITIPNPNFSPIDHPDKDNPSYADRGNPKNFLFSIETLESEVARIWSHEVLSHLRHSERFVENVLTGRENWNDGGSFMSEFWKGLTSLQGYEYIPFYGGYINTKDSDRIRKAIEKDAKGGELSSFEEYLLMMSQIKEQSESLINDYASLSYKAGSSTGYSMRHLGEFFLGNPISGVGRKLILRGFQKSLIKNSKGTLKLINGSVVPKGTSLVTTNADDISKGIYKNAKGKILPLALRDKTLISSMKFTSSLAAVTLIHTPVSGFFNIQNTINELLTPDFIATMGLDDQGLAGIKIITGYDKEGQELGLEKVTTTFNKALRQAYGLQWAEVVTEKIVGHYINVWGGHVGRGTHRAIKNKLFKPGSLLSKMVKDEGFLMKMNMHYLAKSRGIKRYLNVFGDKVDITKALKQQFAFQGAIPEIIEELVNIPLQNWIMGEKGMAGIKKYGQFGEDMGMDWETLGIISMSSLFMKGSFNLMGGGATLVGGGRTVATYEYKYKDYKTEEAMIEAIEAAIKNGTFKSSHDIYIRNDIGAFDNIRNLLKDKGFDSEQVKTPNLKKVNEAVLSGQVDIIRTVQDGDAVNEVGNNKGKDMTTEEIISELDGIAEESKVLLNQPFNKNTRKKLIKLRKRRNQLIKASKKRLLNDKNSIFYKDRKLYKETVKNVEQLIKEGKLEEAVEIVETGNVTEAEAVFLESIGFKRNKKGDIVNLTTGKVQNEIKTGDGKIIDLEALVGKMHTAHGFFIPEFLLPKGSKQKLILNQEIAITEKGANVAGHEFFHFYLDHILKSNPKLKIALGSVFFDHLSKIDPRTVIDSEFRKRLNVYSTSSTAVQLEEAMALYLDGITTGTIKFNESALMRMGGVFKNLAHQMGANLEINTGEQAHNFMVEFMKSVKRGKFSKGLLNSLKNEILVGDQIREIATNYAESKKQEELLKGKNLKKLIDQFKRSAKEDGLSEDIINEIVKQFVQEEGPKGIKITEDDDGVMFSSMIVDFVESQNKNISKKDRKKRNNDIAKEILELTKIAKQTNPNITAIEVLNLPENKELKNELAKLNLGIVVERAKVAARVGKGLNLEEKRKIGFDQFLSGYIKEYNDLLNTYNPAVSNNFGTYAASTIRVRYNQILNNARNKLEQEGVSMVGMDVKTSEGVTQRQIASETDRRIEDFENQPILEQQLNTRKGKVSFEPKLKFVRDQVGFTKETNSAISNVVKKTNYNVKGKVYEDVKKDIISQATKANTRAQVKPTGIAYNVIKSIAQNEYNVDPRSVMAAAQTLTTPESNGIRTKIAERMKEIGVKDFVKSIFPALQYNQLTKKSLGINNAVLSKLYKNMELRVPNIKGKVLNVDNMTDDQIKAAFGINPNFTLTKHTRAFDPILKGTVVQTSVFAFNQAAREIQDAPAADIGIGRPGSAIVEGASDVMFSLRGDELTAEKLGQVHNKLNTKADVDNFILDLVTIINKFEEKIGVGFITRNVAITSSTIGNKQLRGYAKEQLEKLKEITKDRAAVYFYGKNKSDYVIASNKPDALKLAKEKTGNIKLKESDLKKDDRFTRNNFDTSFIRKNQVKGIETLQKETKKLNDKNIGNFTKMWEAIYDMVHEPNGKTLISPLLHWLKGSQDEGNHPNRIGAELLAIDTSVKGQLHFEHALQNAATYRLLMIAAVNAPNKKAFKKILETTKSQYKLIAMAKSDDNKLIATKLGNFMAVKKVNGQFVEAPWNIFENSWWERYFNEHVAAINDGINPNNFIDIMTQKSLAEVFNINSDGGIRMSKSADFIQSQSNLNQAFLNQVKFSMTGKTQGMSTFDFDDTLARTKSGVQYTMDNPSGKPAPQKKVIFLAGGPGSGKSNVIKQLGLEEQGFKIVNQDISLQWLGKNHGLPTDMRDFTPEQASKWSSLQWEARDIAQRKKMKFQGGGDGVIIDGTGAGRTSLLAQVGEFKRKGYDVQMIFVETDLKIALARNKARKERSLKDHIVIRTHESVQKNKKAFKEEFGDNFVEVNTNNLEQGDPMPVDITSKMDTFTKGYIKGRITAEEFANKGAELLEQGAKFDFSEFSKVVEGEPGPYLQTAINRAKKYGTKDMFVLTARPQAAAHTIHVFLKYHGLDIPIKNITGLADSTGEAKANWMLEKFAEGYNDMYFVDDAFANVKAVKKVLDQLDVKSKVVQAGIKFSQTASNDFNNMLERTKGIDAKKIFSYAEARKRGAQPNIIRSLKSLYIPPSAEDFKGLMYYFLGKGKQGEQDLKFFADNLFVPFAKGIRAWNSYKQSMVSDYKALKKSFPEIKLNKKIPGTNFTNDTAIRVYLWNKHGFNIPGISNTLQSKLIAHVGDSQDLKRFADGLSKITKRKEGYIKPSENWMVESIPTDLRNTVDKIGRKEFLSEWINNKDIIFSKENLNKIRALYGDSFSEALDNILYRMENGGNRRVSPDKNTNKLVNWINDSVGAIMFFNMRSAILQTISTVNFINWGDNNMFKASAAFANQPQFWNDFAMLFNSDQLKQRRRGLQIDVSASELTKSFSEGGYSPQTVINYLLQQGFKPTQIADSFAIAFGGASMFRNRYNTYIKKGMSEADARNQAMLDFQEIAEETQQSSREDLISQQQASPLGRIILAFQNVTMQMGRLTKKGLSDIVNGRGDMKTNVSKVIYYGVVQNIVFASLQSALAMIMWGDDEEEIEDRTIRASNQALDSFLRGTGLYGAAVSTLKNIIIQWDIQSKKGYGQQDVSKIALEAINLSPPIGSKIRKIVNAFKTIQYNKGVSEELGWRVENPKLHATFAIIEGLTNIPLERVIRKANNIEEAITGNHLMWQRIAMLSGWNHWSIGVKDEELEEAKSEAKRKRKEKKKKKNQTPVPVTEIEILEEEIQEDKNSAEVVEGAVQAEEEKVEQEEKEEKKPKVVRCSGTNSSGKRCGMTMETTDKKWKCVHHREFKDGSDTDGDGLKEYRCTATKSNGKRCKNKTENKNKKCYAHQ